MKIKIVIGWTLVIAFLIGLTAMFIYAGWTVFFISLFGSAIIIGFNNLVAWLLTDDDDTGFSHDEKEYIDENKI